MGDDVRRHSRDHVKPPWGPDTARGSMPATVRSYQREHPDHWEQVRQLAERFPFVRLIEEPLRERVLEIPTTVSIDVVLGWPLAEQESDGAVWGDVVQVRLEMPGRRYPLGGIMAYVRDGALEREAFRQHLPESGDIVWCDGFEAWLNAMSENISSTAAAHLEEGWRERATPDDV